MDSLKAQLETKIDAAQELKAGGETVHNIYGEMSISLDRLAKLVRGENKWKIDDWNRYVFTPFFQKSEEILNRLYNNQKEIRQIIFRISLIVGLVLILIFFLLPLIKSNRVTLSFNFSTSLPRFNSSLEPSISNNLTQNFMAISTFLAVIVALFAREFWKWKGRPKIKIDFDKSSDRCFRWAMVPLCNIQDEGQRKDVKKYYFRLKVTNNGGTAKKLRVRADIKDKTGREIERFEPSTLQWINRKEETDLLRGESEYVNFLSQVVNSPEIKNRLTIEVFDTSSRGIAWDRPLDTYKYSVTIYGENIKPILVHTKFAPDGNIMKPGKLTIGTSLR